MRQRRTRSTTAQLSTTAQAPIDLPPELTTVHVATRAPLRPSVSTQVLRLERRRIARQRVEINAAMPPTLLSAIYSDHATRFGIAALEVVDHSRAGLGVRTRTKLDPGMRIMICPPGSKIPWLTATAVRCEPDEQAGNFRVGLSVSTRTAA